MSEFFATVARGLESLAARELSQLGAAKIESDFCGVRFEGDRRLLYRVNLWARLPFRILQVIDRFACPDADRLYAGIQSVDWSAYLTPACTLAVDATGRSRALNHSHYTALQVKNAIVDRQRQQFGDRSSVDVDRPDVRINVHIYRDRCTLSLDSSGTSLHRRGYRPAIGKAPLKETLAAALLDLSNWTPELPFLDPLCGSGTLPLEAAIEGLNIAPGSFRDRFGFQSWPDFDRPLWKALCAEAAASRLPGLKAPIAGSDRDRDVLDRARANARASQLDRYIHFACTDLANLDPPADCGVIVCNPPYGERIGDRRQLGEFYKLLGNVLKQRFKGWTAHILSGNKDLAQSIGLKSSRRTPISNGAIACQLLEYELY
ncbi:class I SAM-dependent RNA methyltransferase [Synechococcus sp. PCC 7336]|uniref:THUMP domain-containing class I SAM-dependent RNA methyltransferase n=1 Tax=Synechococcus sp. PCC 7336 TaxID=195250 RepID=UPI000347DC60|nr:THUMP domain-containing protein [Synechococcus sp. PCC 7336]